MANPKIIPFGSAPLVQPTVQNKKKTIPFGSNPQEVVVDEPQSTLGKITKTLGKGAQSLANAEIGFGKEAVARVYSVPQNITKVITSAVDLSNTKKFNEAKNTINRANSLLMGEMKKLPQDDPRRQKLTDVLKSNQQMFQKIVSDEQSAGGQVADVAKRMGERPEILQPKGTAQKFGAGAEKLAEFVYGGAKIANPLSSGATGIIKNTIASPVGQKVAQVATGAGAEGIAAGIIGAGQGQTNKNALKTAGMSAALSIPFKAIDVLREPASNILKRGTEKSMAQALGPTTKENKRITETIAPELLKRKVNFLTRGGLKGKASATADEFGSQIGDAFDALPADAKSAVSPIIKRLEDAKEAFVIKGTNTVPDAATSQYKALQSMQKEILDLAAEDSDEVATKIADTVTKHFTSSKQVIDNLPAERLSQNGGIKGLLSRTQTNIVDQLTKQGVGDAAEAVAKLDPSRFDDLASYNEAVNDSIRAARGQVSVGSLRSFRQILDGVIKKSKGGFGMTGAENAKLAAQKEGANAIREVLARDYPEIAALNKEFTFWKNVEKVVGDTIERTRGQATPLSESIAQGAGAVAGSAMGGTPGKIAFTAVLLGSLRKAFNSPAWKSTNAVYRNSVADAISSGNTKLAEELLNRIAIGVNPWMPPNAR